MPTAIGMWGSTAIGTTMAQANRRRRELSVRLSDEESAMLKDNASRLGVTPSQLVRALISLPVEMEEGGLSSPCTQGGVLSLLVFDTGTFPKLTRQLRAWGHHYNQAVRALNTLNSKRFLPPEDAAYYCEKATAGIEEIARAREGLEACVSELRSRALATFDARVAFLAAAEKPRCFACGSADVVGGASVDGAGFLCYCGRHWEDFKAVADGRSARR